VHGFAPQYLILKIKHEHKIIIEEIISDFLSIFDAANIFYRLLIEMISDSLVTGYLWGVCGGQVAGAL
jgi:hypothetical protein